jgi:hypothetical protein
VPIEKISDYTGLSKEEIEKLEPNFTSLTCDWNDGMVEFKTWNIFKMGYWGI